MATPEGLDDSQRAVLALLLRQGNSYGEIAALLATDALSVRDRAHEAIEALHPAAGGVEAERRHEISDFLLRQQTAKQRGATREYLEGSAAGRSWARAAAAALAPMAQDPLPEIPAGGDEGAVAADPPTDAGAPADAEPPADDPAPAGDPAGVSEQQRGAQLRSRLISGVLGLLVAIALIVVIRPGGFGGDDEPGATTATTATGPAATTSAPGSTTTTGAGTPPFILTARLRSPAGGPASGEAGVVQVASGGYGLVMDATKLQAGGSYGVWLYTSYTVKQYLGAFEKPVGPNGHLEAFIPLPASTPGLRELLLTIETSPAPKKPGKIVLRGELVIVPPAGRTTTTPPPTTTTPR